MLFALVAVVLAQVPDPAADLPPPPPLLDDSAPRPIEPVPAPAPTADPDADLPPLETPPAAEPHDDNDHHHDDVHTKNADWLLLGIDYLIIFVPIPFGGLLIPILQGLVHLLAADSLVHNTYPYWWAGIVAGYAVYALGGALVVGGYVTILVGVFGAGAGGQNTALALGALLGGVVMIALGIAVNFLEPLAAYFAGTWGGQPIGKAAEKSAEDEDPDVGVPASLALKRSLGVQP